MRYHSDWQQQLAQQILTQFQEHSDAWTRVPDILERSSFPQAKVRLHPAHILLWAKRTALSVHWIADIGEVDNYEVEVSAGGSATRYVLVVMAVFFATELYVVKAFGTSLLVLR